MCGRYTIRHPQRLDAALLGADPLPGLVPRYNVAPGTAVPLLRSVDGSRAVAAATWGLIPAWAKDPAIGAKLANARGETVAEKPSFRSAWKARRGLMLADAFYEWQAVPGQKRKQPWCIAMADDAPFGLGALWESWRAPDGTWRLTCCVITTSPNDVMAPIHERMPVIVPRDQWARWLGEAGGAPPAELVAPYAASPMRAWPVSTAVNAPTRDDATLVAPLEGA
jgi:putative SOS response-associated peptidase YedK